MASRGPVRDLCEEATCPICLEYFSDPVILTECGHNFCRRCLTQSWGAAGAAAQTSCPVCKQTAQPGDLRPNRQLANVVEIAKKLSLQGGEATKEAAREGTCEKHREPLKLFCQTEEILICTVCDKSKQHRKHVVVAAEEAAQEYKEKIFNRLVFLKIERNTFPVNKADVERESQEMLQRIESTRQDTVDEFKTLHQLLKEQENCLLAWMEELEKEVARKRDEHLARLSEEHSSLESLIQEIEEKHQQPVTELLQDIRGNLKRYEKRKRYQNPEVFPCQLKQWVLDCCYNPFLKSAMKQFKDTLPWAFPKLRVTVTLDPASASSRLDFSGIQKSVRWRSTAQDLSEDPEKHYGFVLGSEGFTAGCHFWEVSVLFGEGWAVGVARKPVKDKVPLTPEEGIWAVGRQKGLYKAFTKGTDSPLNLRGKLKRIQVCLNFAGGRVAFFDADRAALLYEFSGASFSDETIYPFFAVYSDGWLWLFP